MTPSFLSVLRPDPHPSASVPLAAFQRLRSSRQDEIRDHIGRVFSPHDLAIDRDEQRLAFVHNQVNLERISFNFLDYGELQSWVRIQCPAIHRYILVQFSLAGTCHFAHGGTEFELPAGHFVVLHPDKPFTVRLSPGYKHLMLRLDRAALEVALGRQLGGLQRQPIEFAHVPVATDGRGRAFAALVETVCADFDHSDAVFNRPRVSPHTEDMLMSVLLQTAQHNHTTLLHRPRAESVPFYVRRAEEFMRAHAPEPITFEDLVAAAGASSRSLHAGFRKHRGTTPMRMLKEYRLDLARQQLLASRSGDESVTTIAFNCGFLHLSRFAADYKARFNETPSETHRARA
jgi:AraC-like DNA-binding protein